MANRIPRSKIQLHTLKAAHDQLKKRRQPEFCAIPAKERGGFIQSVQNAIPDMPSAAVQDVLQAEWQKGLESLLSSLQASRLRGIFESARTSEPVSAQKAPPGSYSPLSARLQSATQTPASPFWHQTTAEGPY